MKTKLLKLARKNLSLKYDNKTNKYLVIAYDEFVTEFSTFTGAIRNIHQQMLYGKTHYNYGAHIIISEALEIRHLDRLKKII